MKRQRPDDEGDHDDDPAECSCSNIWPLIEFVLAPVCPGDEPKGENAGCDDLCVVGEFRKQGVSPFVEVAAGRAKYGDSDSASQNDECR